MASARYDPSHTVCSCPTHVSSSAKKSKILKSVSTSMFENLRVTTLQQNLQLWTTVHSKKLKVTCVHVQHRYCHRLNLFLRKCYKCYCEIKFSPKQHLKLTQTILNFKRNQHYSNPKEKKNTLIRVFFYSSNKNVRTTIHPNVHVETHKESLAGLK